jgi:cellulose synthase/poly-beta-1,6-N-acetylglucosamine synthase-like glycosyltransferase
MILVYVFWTLLFALIYAYAGYALVLLLVRGIKILIHRRTSHPGSHHPLPELTLFITAFNEDDCMEAKINNSLLLNYPKEKLQILWVIDGSTDRSAEILDRYPGTKVMHQQERRGKAHAMNRGMKTVSSPIVVFTDANTMLNRDALLEITQPFGDMRTGCVTGEKRITRSELAKAVDAGEGIYWQYESLIKTLESENGSVVGAVGELFAMRTALWEDLQEDTLLDDLTLSMHVLRKGYQVKYTSKAWCTEAASLTIGEEMKRKTRIAAGGIQALTRLHGMLNPFKYGAIAFMFFSHKVMRWTVVPAAIPLLLLTNILLVIRTDSSILYLLLLGFQIFLYIFVLLGAMLKNLRLKSRWIFLPYYLFMMNFAIMTGFVRYITRGYSVIWQKAKRGW